MVGVPAAKPQKVEPLPAESEMPIPVDASPEEDNLPALKDDQWETDLPTTTDDSVVDLPTPLDDGEAELLTVDEEVDLPVTKDDGADLPAPLEGNVDLPAAKPPPFSPPAGALETGKTMIGQGPPSELDFSDLGGDDAPAPEVELTMEPSDSSIPPMEMEMEMEEEPAAAAPSPPSDLPAPDLPAPDLPPPLPEEPSADAPGEIPSFENLTLSIPPTADSTPPPPPDSADSTEDIDNLADMEMEEEAAPPVMDSGFGDIGFSIPHGDFNESAGGADVSMNVEASTPEREDTTMSGPFGAMGGHHPLDEVVGDDGKEAETETHEAFTVPVNKAAPAVLLDVSPRGLGVATAGGYCDIIIERNAAIPIEQSRHFSTSRDEQTEVVIEVYQGESRRTEENTQLGKIELTDIRAAARGEVSILVTFEIDTDGILNVKALNEETKQAQSTTIKLSGGLEDDQVSALVEKYSDDDGK